MDVGQFLFTQPSALWLNPAHKTDMWIHPTQSIADVYIKIVHIYFNKLAKVSM